MKINKILVITGLACTLLTSSCLNDLDIMQDNKITASNMWTEESDATSAAYGLYYYLRSAFNTNYVYWGEYRSGLWGPGTNGTLLNSDQSAVANSLMTEANPYADWSNLYQTINQANLILKYVPTIDMSENGKAFSLANAYFVRALCYFWIARIWGDAPICTEGYESTKQELYVTRANQMNVFNLVESDINMALENVTTSMTDKTVVTPLALYFLKTDYALWMYSVQNAGDEYLTMAEEAISNMNLSPSSLETDFSKIFSSTSKLGKEIIFAIHKENGEAVDGFSKQWFWNQQYVSSAYQNNPVPISDNQWWMYTQNYIDLITEVQNDTRINITYGNGNYGSGNAFLAWPNKFPGQMISGTRVLDSDIIFYRYAQGYLFDAEVKYYRNQYQEALNALSVVTKRAYNVDNYYTDISKEAVLQAIVKENLKEFACEGNIWWTLVRTNTIWDYNASIKSQQDKKNLLLWPITRSSINKNINLKQTEGWEY